MIFPPGMKRPERKSDQSPQSSAEIKNAWRFTSTFTHGFIVYSLIEHGGTYLLLKVLEICSLKTG
jgi:hypothetical protein